MQPWLPNLLTVVGMIIVGCLTVLGSWLVARIASKAANRAADAGVQQAINAGFEALTSGFTIEMSNARLEITELRGWIRELVQHIESLESLLRMAGIEIPKRTQPHMLALVWNSDAPTMQADDSRR